MPAEASKSPADRNTQFIKDASKGRLKAGRKWTDEGMPVIRRGNGNTTALIAASEYGHADVVRELIGAGARLNETTTGRWTALTLAATRGHFEVVKVLLEGGADPNMETKLGDTALSLAMKNGHRRVSVFLEERGARLAELIRRGADVNARAGLGPTPLLLATTNGNLQLMRMLLDGKADVNLTGTIEIWIDVGLPDEKRIRRACGRARQVFVYSYGGHGAELWWDQVNARLGRVENLSVISLPAASTQGLAKLALRKMQLQFTIQEGQIWISDKDRVVELGPATLKAPPPQR